MIFFSFLLEFSNFFLSFFVFQLILLARIMAIYVFSFFVTFLHCKENKPNRLGLAVLRKVLYWIHLSIMLAFTHPSMRSYVGTIRMIISMC